MTGYTMRVSEIDAAISALTIPGVTIRGLDSMPPALTDRDCPCLGPSASGPAFLTDWSQKRISTAGNTLNSYTLNYTLYQAPVGVDRTLFKRYPEMVESARKIAETFKDLPRVNGCKSIALAAMPAFGQVFDASGQQFHGATFALRITEF